MWAGNSNLLNTKWNAGFCLMFLFIIHKCDFSEVKYPVAFVKFLLWLIENRSIQQSNYCPQCQAVLKMLLPSRSLLIIALLILELVEVFWVSFFRGFFINILKLSEKRDEFCAQKIVKTASCFSSSGNSCQNILTFKTSAKKKIGWTFHEHFHKIFPIFWSSV